MAASADPAQIPGVGGEIRLVGVPSGIPDPSWFVLGEAPVPAPAPGEVLVRVHDLSLDPYLRTAIVGRHVGHEATAAGAVMPGRAIGQVIAGPGTSVPTGQWVLAETGWREYAVLPAADVEPIDLVAGVPRSAALGALGMPGLTAYAVMRRHLRPRAGETVVITAATGGVGAVAGALARRAGARAVAVVGDEVKARTATERLGYAAAVVRGIPGWQEALAAATPDRIDAYLHLGAAEVLDAVTRRLARGARISLCGLMDQYNDGPETSLPAAPLIGARAVVHGMVVYDHTDLAAEHRRVVGELLREGSLVVVEDRFVGLAAAPEAFGALMAGRNHGKVVVEVAR